MVVLWFHDPKVPGLIPLPPNLFVNFFTVEDKVLINSHNKIEQLCYTIVSMTLDIIL